MGKGIISFQYHHHEILNLREKWVEFYGVDREKWRYFRKENKMIHGPANEIQNLKYEKQQPCNIRVM